MYEDITRHIIVVYVYEKADVNVKENYVYGTIIHLLVVFVNIYVF